ncbi:MAG: hypothetical protein GY874_12335 [Desulfobacteraceae bacterium]|nr:hypothetical protein [Desulfobacteraceae bacterium]
MLEDKINKSKARYTLNVMLLTAILKYISLTLGTKSIGGLRLKELISSWYDQLIIELNNPYVLNYLANTNSHESAVFYNAVYKETKIEESKLKDKIESEIAKLPGKIKRVLNIPASVIGPAFGYTLSHHDWQKLFALNYMTREYIAAVEGICMDKEFAAITCENRLRFNRIYTNCIRIKSSTFNSTAPDYRGANISAAAKMEDISQFYQLWAQKTGAPFYGCSGKQTNVFRAMNINDTQTASRYGAHAIPADKAKNVFGLIKSMFDFPEKCDISGAVTDILGYALYMENESPEVFNHPDVFIYLNIFVMVATGNYSLFETVAAASLWSSKYYKPFQPLNIMRVLGGLKKENGTLPVSGKKRILNTLVKKIKLGQGPEEKQLHRFARFISKKWQHTPDTNIVNEPSHICGPCNLGMEITQSLYLLAKKLDNQNHR